MDTMHNKLKRLQLFSEREMDLVGVELEFCSSRAFDSIGKGTLAAECRSYSDHTRHVIVDERSGLSRDSIAYRANSAYDSSIARGVDRYGYQLEIVSEPITMSSVPYFLQTIPSVLGSSVRTHDSCGCHFHFNSADLSYNEMVNIILGFAVFEPLLYSFSAQDRIEKKYCKPVGFIWSIESLIKTKNKSDFILLVTGSRIQKKRDKLAPGNIRNGFRKYGSEIYDNVNPRYAGLNVYSSFYRGTFEVRYFENINPLYNTMYFDITRYIIAWALNTPQQKIVKFLDLIRNSPDAYMEFIRKIVQDDDIFELILACCNRVNKSKRNEYISKCIGWINIMFERQSSIDECIETYKLHNIDRSYAKIHGLYKNGLIHPMAYTHYVSNVLYSAVQSEINRTSGRFYGDHEYYSQILSQIQTQERKKIIGFVKNKHIFSDTEKKLILSKKTKTRR